MFCLHDPFNTCKILSQKIMRPHVINPLVELSTWHPLIQDTESSDEPEDEESSASTTDDTVAIQSASAHDDLPDSFVMTRLDVELRQCELSVVEYHQGTESMKPTSNLLLTLTLSGKLELELRRSSWGAYLALQRFNVHEYLSSNKIDDRYRELISFNWQSKRYEMPTDVLKCRINTYPPDKCGDKGVSTNGSPEETVERVSFDVDCKAIKILVNWRCMRALINSFASLLAPAPASLTLPADQLHDSKTRMLAPRRVIDWTIKMASPVIVRPHNYTNADSAALVLELGDVQFKRLDKVPAALMLDSTVLQGQ